MKTKIALVALLGLMSYNANAVSLTYEFFETGASNGDTVLQEIVGSYFGDMLPPIDVYFAGRQDSSTSTLGLSVISQPGGLTGQWTYTDPLEGVIAYVLKSGTEGWIVSNSDLSIFEADIWHDWALPQSTGNAMSYFAVFTDRPQTVPEPGSTLATMLLGVGFLGLAARKARKNS